MSSHVPRTSSSQAALEAESDYFAKLAPHETFWRDKQSFLESHGYMLRPRYHSEWTPSWLSNGKMPELCEDFYTLPVGAFSMRAPI